jgi:hypothetical protein
MVRQDCTVRGKGYGFEIEMKCRMGLCALWWYDECTVRTRADLNLNLVFASWKAVSWRMVAGRGGRKLMVVLESKKGSKE